MIQSNVACSVALATTLILNLQRELWRFMEFYDLYDFYESMVHTELRIPDTPGLEVMGPRLIYCSDTLYPFSFEHSFEDTALGILKVLVLRSAASIRSVDSSLELLESLQSLQSIFTVPFLGLPVYSTGSKLARTSLFRTERKLKKKVEKTHAGVPVSGLRCDTVFRSLGLQFEIWSLFFGLVLVDTEVGSFS
jgi:hypothetical protein